MTGRGAAAPPLAALVVEEGRVDELLSNNSATRVRRTPSWSALVRSVMQSLVFAAFFFLALA